MMNDMFGIDYFALSGLCCRPHSYEGQCPSLRYMAPLGLNTMLALKGHHHIRMGAPILLRYIAPLGLNTMLALKGHHHIRMGAAHSIKIYRPVGA
jgi:hypothetical protein